MNDKEEQRRENDALQSGEGNPAYGQDTRDFGEGGQTVSEALDDDDAPNRDPERDRSLEPAHESASSGRTLERGTYDESASSRDA